MRGHDGRDRVRDKHRGVKMEPSVTFKVLTYDNWLYLKILLEL